MKTDMARKSEKVESESFDSQKKAWRTSGKYVCRHGIFFDSTVYIACSCMEPPSTADWSMAVLMPTISDELKCIIVDTFDQHSYQKLGVVQAEIRRRGW
jgi:hypothetical protein